MNSLQRNHQCLLFLVAPNAEAVTMKSRDRFKRILETVNGSGMKADVVLHRWDGLFFQLPKAPTAGRPTIDQLDWAATAPENEALENFEDIGDYVTVGATHGYNCVLTMQSVGPDVKGTINAIKVMLEDL